MSALNPKRFKELKEATPIVPVRVIPLEPRGDANPFGMGDWVEKSQNEGRPVTKPQHQTKSPTFLEMKEFNEVIGQFSEYVPWVNLYEKDLVKQKWPVNSGEKEPRNWEHKTTDPYPRQAQADVVDVGAGMYPYLVPSKPISKVRKKKYKLKYVH